MTQIKQASFIAAYIAILALILFTAFNTGSLSNLILGFNYSVAGLAVFALFKTRLPDNA